MECEHIFSSIQYSTNTRKCYRCGKRIEGKVEKELIECNTIERYSIASFSGWEHAKIRKYLNINERDLLLHNWEDNYVYVVRR